MWDFREERKDMVERQLQGRGISNRLVLDAFEAVPRHLFVPDELQFRAYEDCPLPIGFRQTISQPFIVAYMLQMLGLTGVERVLEVGTGSGYQAAILSKLSREVHTIELIPSLADRAAKVLADLGMVNVHVHIGDGAMGWAEAAPYDAIVVSAAATHVPGSLLEQLNDPGRMILPVGGSGRQELELWTREGDTFRHETLLPVAFVPLRSRDGM